MAQTINSRDLALRGVFTRTTVTSTALTATANTFTRLEVDNSVTPSNIVITSTKSANLTSPTYVWEWSTNLTPNSWTVVGGNTSTLTVTNTDFVSYVGSASSVNFRVTLTQTGLLPSSAVTTISFVKESDDVVSVVTSVDNTVINADSAGTPTSFANSGITIRVTRNGVNLPFAASGANSFSVGTPTISPVGGVVLGSGSGSGNVYTFANITGITQDFVTVTYPVTIRNSQGVARNVINRTHNYVRVKQGGAGTNTATVALYAKNTSAASPPAAFSGTFTYTFSTAALSGGTLNGWTTTAPSIGKGEYLWVRYAVAASNTATDSVPAGDFSSAVVNSIGGTDGQTGQSNHRVYIAAAISSPPQTPNTTTNGAVPQAPQVWSASPVTLSAGQAQWQSDGTTPAGSTTTTWGTPYQSYLKVDTLEAITTNTGNLIIGTNGSIKNVGGSYNGAGFFLGYDSGSYKFSIGDGTNNLTYNGSTLSVPATTITGILSADRIASNSITTNKLLVTGKGACLNDDPSFQDSSAWSTYSGVTPLFVTITDGKVGNSAIRSTAAGAQSWINVATTKRIPIDSNKSYRLRGWARTVSGSGSVLYIGLALFDSSGNNITGDGSQWSYAPAGGVTVPNSWTYYTAAYGAGNIVFPSNARTMSPLVILSYGGGTSVHEVQDLRIEEMASADLIVDGAITADKLVSNFLYTKAIDINSGTASIDSSGNASFRSIAIRDSNGNVILQSGGNLDFDRVGGIRKPQDNANNTSVDGNGAIQGVSAGAGTAVRNSNISISTGGSLSGAGGGTVTIGGLGYSGDLDANKTSVDGNGAIQGVSAGAGTAVRNSNISISTGGSLSGAGGGTVTIGGLGYSGDLDATRGAPAGTLIAGDLAQNVVRPGNQITSSNISTYLGSTAISDAYIANLNASKINAGFISADRIEANSITTGKLTISNSGSSLLPDPTFEDQSSWAATYGGTLTSFKTVTDAPSGRYIAFAPNGTIARSIQWHPGAQGTKAIPIDRNKQYRFTWWYKVVGPGNSGATSYATLQERDSSGNFIGGNSGHNFYVWYLGSTAPGSWTKVETIVGAGTSNTFSSNTKFVCPSFLLNWENAGGEIQIADVRLNERVDANLIVDGAITANKININDSVVIASGGNFRSGKTGFSDNTNSGWWLGSESNTPKFKIGSGSGNQLIWDGSDLKIEYNSANITVTGVQNNVVLGDYQWGSTGTITATVTLNTNGTSAGGTNWYSPTTTSIGSSYWVKFVAQGAVLPSGTGSWLQLNTARSVSVSQSINGFTEAYGYFQISNSSSGSPVIGGGTWTIQAERGTE